MSHVPDAVIAPRLKRTLTLWDLILYGANDPRRQD